MVTNKDKEKRILNFLKNGEAPQSKISKETAIHYNDIKTILESLKKENKVKSRRSKFETYIYWSLK